MAKTPASFTLDSSEVASSDLLQFLNQAHPEVLVSKFHITGTASSCKQFLWDWKKRFAWTRIPSAITDFSEETFSPLKNLFSSLDLTFSILQWLSSKNLMRLRRVSKRWQALIAQLPVHWSVSFHFERGHDDLSVLYNCLPGVISISSARLCDQLSLFSKLQSLSLYRASTENVTYIDLHLSGVSRLYEAPCVEFAPSLQMSLTTLHLQEPIGLYAACHSDFRFLSTLSNLTELKLPHATVRDTHANVESLLLLTQLRHLHLAQRAEILSPFLSRLTYLQSLTVVIDNDCNSTMHFPHLHTLIAHEKQDLFWRTRTSRNSECLAAWYTPSLQTLSLRATNRPPQRISCMTSLTHLELESPLRLTPSVLSNAPELRSLVLKCLLPDAFTPLHAMCLPSLEEMEVHMQTHAGTCATFFQSFCKHSTRLTRLVVYCDILLREVVHVCVFLSVVCM